MSSKNVWQTLLFRYVRLNRRTKAGEDAPPVGIDGDFPPLEKLVQSIWEQAPTIGKRHVPPLDEDQRVQAGRRYVVPLRRKTHAGTGAVWLRFCVYTGGESPGFLPQDLNASDGAIDYHQVHDDEGEVLTPGMEFSALLLGRVALIQNRRGAGSASAVQAMIQYFGRRLYGSKFLKPKFVHVAPEDVAEQIREAGGVAAVSFGVVEGLRETGATKSLRGLTEIEQRLGGNSRIRIGAPGDAILDAEESLHLLDSPESEGLENVYLHLKDKQTIKGETLSLRTRPSVSLRNGVPDCEDVDRELLTYLQDLMRPNENGQQAIDKKGHIGTKLRIIGIDPKR